MKAYVFRTSVVYYYISIMKRPKPVSQHTHLHVLSNKNLNVLAELNGLTEKDEQQHLNAAHLHDSPKTN